MHLRNTLNAIGEMIEHINANAWQMLLIINVFIIEMKERITFNGNVIIADSIRVVSATLFDMYMRQ